MLYIVYCLKSLHWQHNMVLNIIQIIHCHHVYLVEKFPALFEWLIETGALNGLFIQNFDVSLFLPILFSSYGQTLITSTFIGETSFAILIAILGLVLFAHLIGNMQVLFHCYLPHLTSVTGYVHTPIQFFSMMKLISLVLVG